MNVRRLLSVLALIAGVTTAPSAFAVCIGVVSYTASAAGTSLVITPDNLTRRVCRMGGTEILLRQNVETGAIVRMPDACSGQGWRDECVPRGTYRYGFAMPYECCPQCCNTDYFVQFTVMLDPPANCEATRDPTNPRPMPYAGQAPWAAAKEICRYVPLPDSGVRPPRRDAAPEPDPTGGMPTGTGGAPPPGSPAPGGNNTGGGQTTGGCSVGGAGGSAAVAILAGLVLAVGFVRVSERRRRPRS